MINGLGNTTAVRPHGTNTTLISSVLLMYSSHISKCCLNLKYLYEITEQWRLSSQDS